MLSEFNLLELICSILYIYKKDTNGRYTSGMSHLAFPFICCSQVFWMCYGGARTVCYHSVLTANREPLHSQILLASSMTSDL